MTTQTQTLMEAQFREWLDTLTETYVNVDETKLTEPEWDEDGELTTPGSHYSRGGIWMFAPGNPYDSSISWSWQANAGNCPAWLAKRSAGCSPNAWTKNRVKLSSDARWLTVAS